MRKKVVVSACLLGENCRYDGKTKQISKLQEVFKAYEIIPFCPEAPLFGVPRERISVVEVENEYRIITDETGIDVTLSLEVEIENFYKLHPQVDAIVLKSKSPSCGYKTTPIKNTKDKSIKFGSGIAARMFEKYYEGIEIKDENLML